MYSHYSFSGSILRALNLIFCSAPYQVTGLIALIVVQGSIPAINIQITAKLIESLSMGNLAIKNDIFWLGGGWAACLLVNELINPILLYFQGNVADKVVFLMNDSVTKKASSLQSMAPFEEPEFHNTIQIIQSQSHHKPINLVVTLVGLLKDTTIVASCLWLLSGLVSWITILALLSAYINFRVFSTIQRKTWQESLGRSPDSRKMSYILSTIINPGIVKELRLFDKMSDFLRNTYTTLFQSIYASTSKLRLQQIYWPILPLSFSCIVNFISLHRVIQLSLSGKFHTGAVVMFLQSLTQLNQSVSSFGEQAGWLQGHMLFFDKYFEFMNFEEKKVNNTNLKSINKLINIRFDKVYFTYPNGQVALQNISFSITQGEKIALVGKNGAGKSTIIKLLCGFYQPDTGEIYINDMPLSTIDILQWRQLIASVFQDFATYALPISDNISMGAVFDDELMTQCLHESGAAEFVDKLPKKLKQELGKPFGGTDLSMGQWQKIALARAMYKKAPLCILDEPTASLDPLSEHQIFQKFFRAFNGNTVLFVTHRLGSVKMVDKIMVLNDSELIAIGQHDELIKSSSTYREMYQCQADRYADEVIPKSILIQA